MRILHMALESDWLSAVEYGEYRVSTRGRTLDEEGFIHCSTPTQVHAVAAAFYADVTEPLVLLELDDEAVRATGVEVRYEDGGKGEFYPHIYAAIDPSWVSDVQRVRMRQGTLHPSESWGAG
jgi:glutathione S-transferase